MVTGENSDLLQTLIGQRTFLCLCGPVLFDYYLEGCEDRMLGQCWGLGDDDDDLGGDSLMIRKDNKEEEEEEDDGEERILGNGRCYG